MIQKNIQGSLTLKASEAKHQKSIKVNLNFTEKKVNFVGKIYIKEFTTYLEFS